MNDRLITEYQYLLACKAILTLEKKQHLVRLDHKKAMDKKIKCSNRISKLKDRLIKTNNKRLPTADIRLKIVYAQEDLKKYSKIVSGLRGQLMKNRTGKDGLRHLNTIIRMYYHG